MDSWTLAQVYGLISLAVAGTSYFTLYRPAIELTEEIVDKELPLYRGWFGTSLWFLVATLVSPITTLLLLKNNNADFINTFALNLADRIIDDEEDE